MLPILLLLACKPPVAAAPVELASLTEGQVVEGFRVEALYVDGEGDPLGVRLLHEHTRMPIRLLQWDSVPQSYLWVETVPDDDQGEPHTQEHLLLGKGNQGRSVSTLESMSLVRSTAFTDQHQTVYHFRTTAGPDVFFDVFDARLDAMLHPDYLDEEIRREVHHWGVAEGPDGLVLEEKGTVYNEMASSYQQPGWALWSAIAKDLYGAGHPQTFESGGHPDALRGLGPEQIRAFHAATHQLANMGAILFLPDTVPLTRALDELDATFKRLQPEPTPAGADFVTEADLPPPKPVADRSVRELRYPSGDASADASLTLAFPPTRDLSPLDRDLLDLLLGAIAGAENTNLYRALVDGATRERDLGAREVFAWAPDDQGDPVYFGVEGLRADLADDDVRWLADRLRAELARVAALPAGDPALVDLHRRIAASLDAWKRSSRDDLTGTPGFGDRGTGTQWYDHLADVDAQGGFRRPLLMTPYLASLEAELARPENLWATRLAAWGLLDAEPFVYVNRPSPEALADLDTAKQSRAQAKLAELMKAHGTDDPQVALAAFQRAYDEGTVALEAAQRAPEAKFLDDPPLVPDDGLDAEVRTVAGVPVYAGRFDAMQGAKLGLLLDLSGVPDDRGMWANVLPALLTEVGVVRDGAPIPHDVVLERLQREVLYVNASNDTRASKDRARLGLYAGGTDPAETRAAIGWAATFLTSPDWRPENLPRLRDVVDQRLGTARNAMTGPEERWTWSPAQAWEHQDKPLQLHLSSFLTYEHDLLRLKYRLTTPEPAASATLRALAAAKLDRATLVAVLGAWQGRPAELPKAAKGLVPAVIPPALAAVGQDLERTVGAVPDASLQADVAYLAGRLATDLDEDPKAALAELDALRRSLLSRGGATVVVAGGAMLDGLDAELAPLLGALTDGPVTKAARSTAPVVLGRVAGRGGAGDAVHVGLFDPNRRSGVVILTAPLTSLAQTDEEHLLDYLAARTLGGGGAHALFIRTWGAGLAYSNGSSANESDGRMRWSAERCPTLPQTVGFVRDVVRETSVDDDIAAYAIAGAFWSRADGTAYQRTAAWADDLVDQQPPEAVRAFREALLAQRARPDLAAQLEARVEAVYGRVLPGLGARTEEIEGARSFAIGDRGQLDTWDAWLEQEEGRGVEVLYPRDFWIVAPG